MNTSEKTFAVKPEDSSVRVLVDQRDVPLDGSDTTNEEAGAVSSPFDTSQIRIEPKNGMLAQLIRRMENEEIDLDPEFQRRGGIWSDQAQSRLIESLMLRIPIPAFYFDASNPNKWLVVDGLQRLTAIRRFVIDRELKLSGLQFLADKYNGASFDALPRPMQRAIEEADIVMYQIMPGTPSSVKFTVFQRINTGGLPLSSQEIRHALNQGPVTRKLAELANSEEFKMATSGGVSPKRMDDRECVARFIVFSMFSPESYDKDDFDAFLNAGMAEANKQPECLEEIGKNFLRVMRAVPAIFDNDAFRKRFYAGETRFPVNKALFEAWSVNLGKLSNEELEILRERRELVREKFMELMRTDRSFEAAITQGTGSIARVKHRFGAIEHLIKEVLHAH